MEGEGLEDLARVLMSVRQRDTQGTALNRNNPILHCEQRTCLVNVFPPPALGLEKG